MDNSTYQHKRDLFDLLDFRAIFRVDEGGRWLDVSCGLKPEGDVIVLDHSSEISPEKVINQNRIHPAGSDNVE